jgi:ankyrin repeat protein
MENKAEQLSTLLRDYVDKHPKISPEDVVKEFQSEGKTLLHLASSSGHIEVLKCVLSYICDKKSFVNQQDNNGFSPLVYATISESLECMKELVASGADMNLVNKDGAAPAHFAAGDGSMERLKFLFDHGADLKLVSNSGTLLHWAAGKGRSEAIK